MDELMAVDTTGMDKATKKQLYNMRSRRRQQHAQKELKRLKEEEEEDLTASPIQRPVEHVAQETSEEADDELTLDDIERIIDRKLKRHYKEETKEDKGSSFMSWQTFKGFFFPLVSMAPIVYRSYKMAQSEPSNPSPKNINYLDL